MLSRFVIAFLPKSKCLLTTICSDFGAQENKICLCFHFSPFYLPWSDGTRCHDLSFLNVEFQACFLTLLYERRELFSSSSVSAIRVVLSAYLRLLIFLPGILIRACASFRLAFHMMYSAYKLNNQGDSTQLCHTHFPRKEYDKAAYFHPAYLTYMQSTSCEIPGWMNHKLESRLLGEISTDSNMEMMPL